MQLHYKVLFTSFTNTPITFFMFFQPDSMFYVQRNFFLFVFVVTYEDFFSNEYVISLICFSS